MNSEKNLIVFSYDFPPSNGGIARLCQEIASGMKPYYKNVKVLTRKKKGLNVPYNLKEVEIVFLPNLRILCELYAILYLMRIRSKNKYDILCGTWHPEAILSLLSGFKNVFVLGHGAEFISGISSFRKNIWLKYYAKFVLDNVKLTIANSGYTKRMISNISEFAKCSDLPLGVNHDFFKPIPNLKTGKEIFKICTVSRIEEFKGHDFVAKVLIKLFKDFPNRLEWNIAGTGGHLPELVKIVNELELQDIVKFHGFVNDNDLPAFYNQNDIFILCTREKPNSIDVEGFGLVFLEAQSCGIPVVGTNTGGISDAIEMNNGGWLVEQDNESELYDLLFYLLNNESIVDNEGTKARSRVVNKCTWDIYCEKLSKLMK